MISIDAATLKPVVSSFQIREKENMIIEPFGSGLIHHTWKVLIPGTNQTYILQRINDAVFRKPWDIASNIRRIQEFLQHHFPGYLFIAPIQTNNGRDLFFDESLGYFRLFPFLVDSHAINVVTEPKQAYEASRQFALFTRQLSDFQAQSLKTTLPDFHNLLLRYRQFEESLLTGNSERINISTGDIEYLKGQQEIVYTFDSIKRNPAFRLRVTHHDTKISNVLFDRNNKGLCVIDLDTVMSGYFISDVGDMMRTYLSPASEEERDLSKILIREDIFNAIVTGYLSEMNEELSSEEKKHFIYAGKFMIYMQALRFLTDYLNNDRYYGAKYEQHNLDRAKNQIVLLQKLVEKESALSHLIDEYIKVNI